MIGKLTFTGAASIAALALTSPALAQASPASGNNCGKLTGMALENGTVTSAALVAPGAFSEPANPFGPPPDYSKLPAFCRVQATLTPTSDSDIKVEIWLPANGWNGKFVGIGNGVWAGKISFSQMGSPLSRGYAVASTDTGHSGNGLTAEWAVGHPEKLIDFGHRAVHLMTATAKQSVRAFYGEAPSLSLWDSCSTGGRQGLMSAHRYPNDYDAISAKAPANPMTDLMTQTMWTGWMTKRTAGASISPTKMGMIHRAAIKQCDAQDGLTDGLISRPGICDFDPGTLICKASDTDSCLTAPQVEAMRDIYGGVQAKDGTRLLPGFPYGSEIQLAVLMMGEEPFPVATDYFRLLTFGGHPGWDWTKMNYRTDMITAREYGGEILNAPYDGLGPFFARGGKLLLSHGWNDGLIPANNTAAYYSDLYRAIPLNHAQNDLRLFMAPGMDHCGGGEGPSSYDTLGTIDAWATTGRAPSRITATRMPSPMPGAPKMPPMSRPLCPYPLVAKYDGTGDTNDAENFDCTAPEN